MISKINRIQSNYITKPLSIIIPETLYEEDGALIIQPQIAAQLDLSKIQYNKKVQFQQERTKNQFSVNKTIQYLKGCYIIAYEKADCDLQKELQGEISFKRIRQYLYEILYAISQLHNNKICHNDIKPSNCLIFKNEQYTAKLADFDLSKDLSENQQQSPNILITNPMYTEDELIDSNNTTMNFASPETNSMLKVKSGYLSDIWSYGQLVLYCFTGIQLNIQIVRNGEDFQFFTQLFGKDFADLVSLCTETQSLRPSAEMLLSHPFFTGKNLDAFTFDLKESLSARLLHGSAKQLLRSSSLPNRNILNPNQIVKFQNQQKMLLNEINVALRNEIPCNYGSNSDKITEMLIQKNKQFKINRSQSLQYKKKNKSKIQTLDFLISYLCNENKKYIQSEYVEYFVIDKLDLYYLNDDNNSRYIQNLILINNLYILSNVTALDSLYFNIYKTNNLQQGEYKLHSQEIQKLKKKRQYTKQDLCPLPPLRLNPLKRNQSLSSSRLKTNQLLDNLSLLGNKNLQKSFSKSCIQLIDIPKRDTLISQTTESDVQEIYQNSYNKVNKFEDLSFESESQINSEEEDVLKLEEPYIQMLNIPSNLHKPTDEFNIVQLAASPMKSEELEELSHNNEAQSPNKTNLSLNLSKSTLNESKSVQTAFNISPQQLKENLFELDYDETIEEIYSDESLILQSLK